jgi:hypothetical protein
MAAHDRAIEQQHRHVQPMPTPQLGIPIHVDDVDGRQRDAPGKSGQLLQHFLAQLAVAPVHDRQTRPHLRTRQWLADAGAGGPAAFTCVAMNCTVSGGTSPTAVTLWPSTTVEKAEEEPTVAVCGALG